MDGYAGDLSVTRGAERENKNLADVQNVNRWKDMLMNGTF